MAVRGSFDLNDKPASEALRSIRREGALTERQMRSLGDAVDDVFSTANREAARAYERDLRSVDRTAVRSLGNLRREWRTTEREVLSSVAKQEAEIGSLETSLRSLGTVDARPNINLHGFAEANAQIDTIEARLRSLGAVTARPNVNVSGGWRPPGSSGGSRGGSGFGGRGLNIPFAGRIPWPLVGGALAAAPPLVGGATGLLGSAASATLGLGALGLTGGGVAAVGAGTALPSTIMAAKGISAASKAFEKYQQEVIQSGPNSEAARVAFRELNMELRDAPRGTRRFLASRQALGREFAAATRPGQASVAAMATRGINLGRQLTPLTGQLSNRFLGEAQGQTDQFAGFLNDRRSRDFYRAMSAEATADLSSMESISENVLATMMNIARAGRPFFHEAVEFVDDWTGGWSEGTRDIHDTRRELGQMVDDLRAWGHLGGAGFDLIQDLFGASRQPGTSLVESLTDQLREWDRWVERNPAQVSQFFEDSAEGTEKIAGALSRITGLLWRVSRQLTPLLEQGANFVELLGNAGLLTPGGLPLLLGAGAGVRGAFGRGGGTARGGAAGGGAGAPIILGGGGAAAAGGFGSLFDRETYGLARGFGRGRLASTVAGLGAGSSGARAAAGGRSFGRSFGPYALLSAGLGAAGTEGNIWERLQGGISQASLGLVAPPKTQAQEMDEGMQEAAQISARLGRRFGDDPSGLTQQIHALLRRRGEAMTPQPHGGLTGFLTTSLNPADEFLTRPRFLSDEARQRARGFTGQIGSLREQRASVVSQSALGEIQGAFGIRTRHGEDPGQAFEKAASSIESRAGRMKGRTGREFSQMGLNWARSMARSNPKLKGAVDDLARSIENRLNKTGENVRIINGRIVDVSAKSWKNVADLIGTQTQRAYSEANENLTALEKRAFTILRQMGYSQGDAKALVYEAQHGHPSRQRGQEQATAHHFGRTLPTTSSMDGRGHATGGRLPMPRSGSMHDVLSLGGGNMAAGGELVVGPNVANRHTERKIDRMLLSSHGTTLAREIGREGRAHSEPFRGPFREYNAATGSIYAAAKLAQRLGLSVGEGPGFGGVPSSGHASGSLHYSGLAYDVSGSPDAMRRYFFSALRSFRGSINELFYDPIGWYMDEGHRVPGAMGGHSDHVHIGFFPGGAHMRRGGLGGLGAMGGRGGAMPRINLRGNRSGLGGLPGAAATRGNEMAASGMSQNLNRLLRGSGGMAGPAPRGGSIEAQIARSLLRGGLNRVGAAGIIGNAYAESSLKPGATGYGGGGLWGFTASPNSLADLQAYAEQRGRPWTNATLQTQFLLSHVSGGLVSQLNAAGTPEAAAALFMSEWERPGIPRQGVRESAARRAFSHFSLGGQMRRPGFAGWFGRGGHFRVHNPTLFGAGERGPEEVSVTPLGHGGRKRGRGGGRPISISVKTGPITVGNGEDARRVGHRIAEGIEDRLADTLESSDGVAESELTG